MPYKTFFNLPEYEQTQILMAAIQEFSGQTYRSASILAIVGDAETFYQYFEDKKDLYLFVLKLGMARKLELVNTLKPPINTGKTFDYLKWMMQASVQFEILYPDLARIAYRAFIEEIPFHNEIDDLVKQGGAAHFNDLLAQGILHDDVAPWVDTDMAAFLFQTLYHSFGTYLLNRLKTTHPQDPAHPSDVFEDQAALDLFNNLMDLLEAGMGRDPEIRKHYYPK